MYVGICVMEDGSIIDASGFLYKTSYQFRKKSTQKLGSNGPER